MYVHNNIRNEEQDKKLSIFIIQRSARIIIPQNSVRERMIVLWWPTCGLMITPMGSLGSSGRVNSSLRPVLKTTAAISAAATTVCVGGGREGYDNYYPS